MNDADNTLSKDIMAAIDASLTNEVGVRLKQVLSDYQSLKAQHQKQSEIIKGQNDRIADLNAENSRIAELLALNDRIAEREKAVQERELKADLLETKLKCEVERRADMFNLVSLVFKSQAYNVSLSGNVPLPVSGTSTMNGFIAPSNQFTANATAEQK